MMSRDYYKTSLMKKQNMPTTQIDRLLSLSPAQRRNTLQKLDANALARVYDLTKERQRNPWLRFADKPIEFVEEGLGETLWSKQKEILMSLRDNKRTAVPSCHGLGKSHLAARAVAWWAMAHPVGTARVVTTATNYRQVRGVLWPHIRRVARRHDLIGEVFTTEWQINGEIVADGFSAYNHDETAVQGVHAPHLLVVVDEAGGISPILGNALESLMTGGHTRLLIIGNPPVDNESSWFERVCNSDVYNVIPIATKDTPNFTGEKVGLCKACPSSTAPHELKEHLVDLQWQEDVIKEFGEDSPFVEARVHARFPRVTANRVIPFDWVERSQDMTPLQTGHLKLGVDVAADGGDEFAIAVQDGMNVSLVHKTSGAANASAVDVAGIVLQHILEAEKKHKERQIADPVRVKVDVIGVGWGVSSILRAWRDEQRHRADIVPVNVAERSRDADRFNNQRAEMWWNMRVLLQTDQNNPFPQIKVDLDQKTIAQLTSPIYKSDSAGRIQIESKKEMKRRGRSSPDRAEAILLALYEPKSFVVPEFNAISLEGTNEWGAF
jgi:hypothetical protein